MRMFTTQHIQTVAFNVDKTNAYLALRINKSSTEYYGDPPYDWSPGVFSMRYKMWKKKSLCES